MHTIVCINRITSLPDFNRFEIRQQYPDVVERAKRVRLVVILDARRPHRVICYRYHRHIDNIPTQSYVFHATCCCATTNVSRRRKSERDNITRFYGNSITRRTPTINLWSIR
jgi:hypothetical protein